MRTEAQPGRPALSPTRALARLAELRRDFGQEAAIARLQAFRILDGATLTSASAVAALHESLCFAHAYPDNADVFTLAASMLRRFGERRDLVRFRTRLENSGIAGTNLLYPFAAPTARWLVDRWPEYVDVAWGHGENREALESRLPLLTAWGERAVFDEPPLDLEAWLARLRGPDSAAAFLVRRSAACTGTSLLGNQLYDELAVTLRVSPGPDTPSRSRARASRKDVVCQAAPLRGGRPDLREAARVPPKHVADVQRRDALRLIDLAREAMVTRKRDLYTFAAADPRDVRMIDCGDGVEFACYGVQPEQRLMLDAVYGFLMLRNGVPIGYALASALWRSSEIAFNVFDTYRGAEGAWVYGRLLSIMRHLFGADTFAIYPYQLGHENDEGLESGAWWFYYKMGFRPKDPETLALATQEAQRVAAQRRYRTSLGTLRRLVRAHLFLHLEHPRTDVIGLLQTDRIALAVTDLLNRQAGADRERAAAMLAGRAAEAFGAGPWRQWPDGERLFWERWAPLTEVLPGTARWSPQERLAFVDIVRAKGSRRESDYVALFDAHPQLGAALVALAAGA